MGEYKRAEYVCHIFGLVVICCFYGRPDLSLHLFSVNGPYRYRTPVDKLKANIDTVVKRNIVKCVNATDCIV